MAINKIHSLDQSLFDNRGVCYFVCEFLQNNQLGPWYDFHRKNYATLRQNAINFTNYVACFNWAKNARNNPQEPLASYNFAAPVLTPNHFFRIGVYIGPSPAQNYTQNHELMCITGVGTTVLLFDPNMGFWEIDAAGTTLATNKQVVEYYLAFLYRNTPAFAVREFSYRDLGVIK